MIFKNKKVLLMMTPFFGYDKSVYNEIVNEGGIVESYNPRCFNSALGKAILKLFPEVIEMYAELYHKKMLSMLNCKEFDYILTNDLLPTKILKKLKVLYPNTKLILYCDDSIDNYRNMESKLHLFDAVYSFDLQDSEKYNLRFRPLYYIKEYSKSYDESEYMYDICFVGTCHSDRYRIVKLVQNACSKKGYKFFKFLFLQSWFMYYYHKITNKDMKNAKKEEFELNKLSSSEVANIIQNSKAVLDIQHPKQSGLTIRTIECIGMKAKIITTNESISKYDFYRSENIYIINRNNPQFGKDFDDFIYSDYKELPENIFNKYSLHQWLLDVFLSEK